MTVHFNLDWKAGLQMFTLEDLIIGKVGDEQK